MLPWSALSTTSSHVRSAAAHRGTTPARTKGLEEQILDALERLIAIGERQAAGVDASRADLAGERVWARLAIQDVDTMLGLMPAVGGELGDEPFLANDLCTNPAFRSVINGRSARSLGILLSQVIDAPLAGFVVQSAGTSNGTARYAVKRVRF